MTRKKLAPGTRVRLADAPIPMELDVLTGTIVGPDVWDDYFIVRLDRPGRYFHADGRVELLHEIREMGDNLTVTAPAKRVPASEPARQG